MNGYNLIKKKPVLWLTMVAVLMAMNVVLSSFSIPVPGGHLYLNDIVICTAAILLDPLGAFIVGGVGAFLGDFFFYPAPMFVSLASHGLEAVVVSLCAHNLFKEKKALGAGIVNCTPFVRQYDILSNRWGDLLCQEENRTNDIRRNSRKWL